MAGSKFQYDESGGTFFYFLLSFLALILIPLTYYLWKGDKPEENEKNKDQCNCEKCETKRRLLTKHEPWKKAKQRTIKILLVLGWCAFIAIACKVTNLERDHVDWDPFEILQIDRESNQAEIKKAYRKLSLIYHPDKDTGDERKFMQLTKAYAALTDDEARKNWEMYGNPDGPGAMSFGIALPSWIVEKENSIVVLGIYALVFMVALPIIVGVWWYRSIKYGGEQVLLDTTHLYYYFFNKSPQMNLKRVLMVLSASWEFEKGHNGEVVERPSDNIEVPKLFRELPNIGEKNKEKPLCFPYSLKARSLLHAHLSRLPLPLNTLDIDRLYIIKKCPNLIHEMIQTLAQLTAFAHAGRIRHRPAVETIEHAMKLSPMIVQALWEKKSPLLQLPHIDDEIIRYLFTRKNVRTITQLVKLNSEDRRMLLKNLSDVEYENVMNVAKIIPDIKLEVRVEVLDDDESAEIIAGDIVTVTVCLTRNNLGMYLTKESTDLGQEEQDEEAGGDSEPQQVKKAAPVWQKKNKGRNSKQKNQKKKPQQKPNNKKQEVKKQDEKSQQDAITKSSPKPSIKDSEAVGDSDSEADSESESVSHEDNNKLQQNGQAFNEEDDEDWEKLQSKITRREKVLETKSKKSHTVHCPYFSEEKQEYWWIYIIDKKAKTLVTPPYHVTDLVDFVEVPLKFAAPPKADKYFYTVHVRSDSYVDSDRSDQLTLHVKGERREAIEKHPQWDSDSEEEKEGQEASGVSDFTTDDEDVSDAVSD